MKRRTVLVRCMLTLVISSPAYARPTKPEAKIKIIWGVPTQGLSTAKKYLGPPESMEPDRDTATDTRGLPLIFIITAVALVPQVAEAIVRVYRDYKYGGVIIVADRDGLKVSTDRQIPATTVVIRNKDGISVFERKNSDAGELAKALTSVLDQIKK